MMKKPINGSESSLKCEICEDREAKYVCRICGRRVCEEDYSREKGICKVCEMSLCEICKRHLAVGKCEKCGRIICEECTAYFDGARRICKECFTSFSSSHL